MKIEVSNEKGKVSCYCDNNESKEVLIERTRGLMKSIPESEFYDLEIS